MKLGEALNKTAVTRTYRPSPQLPLPTCLTGVEMEVEGVREDPPAALIRYWERVRDDSLRGSSAEFVLRDPLFGEDLLIAIRSLCTAARAGGWESNYRTSIHVHLDMRDVSFPSFRAMCCVYPIVEPVLFHWIGDKRDESVFCLPWSAAEGDIEKIRSMFTAQGPALLYQSDALNRYSALNLKALAKQGSVEFRHMRTTFDDERIIKWVQICQHIRRFSELLEDTNRLDTYLLDMYSALKMPGFLEEVFGPTLATELLRGYNGPDFTPGILLCQDLLSNEMQKKLGLIFCPANAFLTPGANKQLKAWKKINKGKKAEKSELPPLDRYLAGERTIPPLERVRPTTARIRRTEVPHADREWLAPIEVTYDHPPLPIMQEERVRIRYDELPDYPGEYLTCHAWRPTIREGRYAAYDLRNEDFFLDENDSYRVVHDVAAGVTYPSLNDQEISLGTAWHRAMARDLLPEDVLVELYQRTPLTTPSINPWR